MACKLGFDTPQIYDDAIFACANHGKWRKAINVIDKMHSNNMPISEAALNSAIHGCCVGSSGCNRYAGLRTAMSLLMLLKQKQLHCKLPVYYELLSKLCSAGLSSEFDEVWRQLEEDGGAVSDAMYGLRAEMMAFSDRLSEANSTAEAMPHASGLCVLLTVGKLRGLLRRDNVDSAEAELR